MSYKSKKLICLVIIIVLIQLVFGLHFKQVSLLKFHLHNALVEIDNSRELLKNKALSSNDIYTFINKTYITSSLFDIRVDTTDVFKSKNTLFSQYYLMIIKKIVNEIEAYVKEPNEKHLQWILMSLDQLKVAYENTMAYANKTVVLIPFYGKAKIANKLVEEVSKNLTYILGYY